MTCGGESCHERNYVNCSCLIITEESQIFNLSIEFYTSVLKQNIDTRLSELKIEITFLHGASYQSNSAQLV